MSRVLVAGAGGFIGGYLVNHLVDLGYSVRAVDKKSKANWYQVNPLAENIEMNLQYLDSCHYARMGFIENNKALCMLSVLINTHLLQASLKSGVQKFFFASSACVYSQMSQLENWNEGLKESDAYPALPEDGYGWEKLFSERMCRHFDEDFGIATRVARFHNVYGPKGTWNGGREKAPAAICRKIAVAKLTGNYEIEIWGDGNQGRSFMWIDDCIEGIIRIMDSNSTIPINLGSSALVSINQLVDLVSEIAGVDIVKIYNLDAPQGVRGRNSDNSLLRELTGWEPSTKLIDGLRLTYAWVEQQVKLQLNEVYDNDVKPNGYK